MALKYVGNGAAVPGIPARDLTNEEVEACGGEPFLLSLVEAEKPLYAKESARRAKDAPQMEANTSED